VIASVFRAEGIDASERLDTERLARDLRARGRSARHLGHADAIAAWISGAAEDGDVVVVMSNGGFDGLHEKLLERLRSRATTPQGPHA
jgi:UDP-N-acetylmuramate: L-alanyl-gamma-D-glutamyl-meso-diaminopimelate ligase